MFWASTEGGKVCFIFMGKAFNQGAGVFEIAVDSLNRSGNTVFLKSSQTLILHIHLYGTYRANLFSNLLRPLNLLLISGRGDQCVGKALHGELADSRSDTKSLDTISPEVLVAEEWLDDSRDTSCCEALAQQSSLVEDIPTSQTRASGTSPTVMTRRVDTLEEPVMWDR